jgi:2-methylcitrate dehydratase PrpD
MQLDVSPGNGREKGSSATPGGSQEPPTPSIAAHLADFAVASRGHPLPADVSHAVRRQILDALGVATAARVSPIGDRLRGVESLAGGKSVALGFEKHVAEDEAALVNGMLVHALDFDDTYQPGIVHVGAVVVPTVLAVGQAVGATDADIEHAVAVGYELDTRLGEASAGKFHLKGFHATPICGALSAAVVASLLRGSDAAGIVNAMGIAGSFSGGLQQFLDDGADTKRLHPGWAAHAGIRAASFAAAGFGGPAGVIEGRYGVYASHVGLENFSPTVLTEELGSRWNITSMSVKPYPCCHLLHAFIDAVRELRAAHGLVPDDIVQIRAHASHTGLKILTQPPAEKTRPSTAYSAQFSLPYAIAVALLDESVGLHSFDVDRLGDRSIHDLIDRVTCHLDEESNYPEVFDGLVEMDLRDGRTLVHREAVNRGSPQRALTDEELVEKFRTNLEFAGIDRGEAERVAADVLEEGAVTRGLNRLHAAVSRRLAGEG